MLVISLFQTVNKVKQYVRWSLLIKPAKGIPDQTPNNPEQRYARVIENKKKEAALTKKLFK